MLKTFIDILYPRRCPICGDIAMPRGELACTECEPKLNRIKEPRCKKCSKPIEDEEKEFCHDCEKRQFHYVKGYALWVYDAVMKNSISQFKFHGRVEYGEYYAEEIVKRYGRDILNLSPDVLLPVPIHKDKLKKRGFNQAEVLAAHIGRRLGIPVLSDVLYRDKNTLPQKQLNDKERLKNLEKAFVFSKEESEKYRNIIQKAVLIDDIYTTGSTIEACTNILLKNGIKEVYFISVSIGKGF